MKRFYIDTNFNWLGSWKPAVFPVTVREEALQVGERVVVYQDEGDEWTGTVRFDGTLPEAYQWYVELDQAEA